MKKTRKLLMLILTLTTVVCLISAFGFSSSAAETETIEVSSWSQFRDALMQHNDYKPVEIKLTNSIYREFDDYEDFDYGLFAVSGNKTIDLNGHTITAEVTIGEENAQYLGGNHFPYLFSFLFVDSSLTIKDTSAAQTGKVHYDASLVAAKKYITSPICNIFSITNGSVTIEGGTFEVGHERKDWTTAVYVNGKLFTGNLRTQVYGNVFTVGKNASLTINDGTFIARGGHLINDTTNRSAFTSTVFRKTSTENSSVTINGGEFIGKGGAAIFDTGTFNFGIKINNGVFKTTGIDNVLFRYGDKDGGNLAKGDMNISSSMLADRIENKVIINAGKTYTYSTGSSPQNFYKNRENTTVFTAYDFTTATPAIPTDRVTSVIDDHILGVSKIFSYTLKPLPKYVTDAGFGQAFSLIVRDGSNAIVASNVGESVRYDLNSIKKTGTYTITATYDLFHDGKVLKKKEHTFIVDIYLPCEHTYTVISNTATCTESGTKTERCTLCGDEKITDVAALDHLSLASDWTYNSTHHWYYCRRCYTPTLTQAHSWKSSTNRICSVCRYNDNCEWGNAMDTEHDENYHWWPCDTHSPDESCPNNHQLERELHTILTIENAGSLEHEPQIEYSCQNGYVCEGCGEYFGETGEHKWVAVPAREGGLKPATCTESGYVKYKCEYDGKYDCKGNKITCSETKTVTIPALGHNYDYNNPDSDTATCTQDGVYTYTCTRARCAVTKIVNSPALGHSFGVWETVVEPTCNEKGESKAICERNGCSATKTVIVDATGEHTYEITLTPAKLSADGKVDSICSVCSNEEYSVAIPAVATVKLSTAECTYNGKTRSPSVTVKDTAGNTLVKGTDYDVTVPSGRKMPGVYEYVITFKGNYEGEKKLDFTILPAKVDVKTISATQSTSVIKLTWGAVEGATGYRVYQYSPSKKAYVQIASVKGVTSYRKATNLKAGTEYKFKVKAYTKLSDGTVLWATASNEFLTATECKAPSITSVTSSSKSKATVKWSNVDGETGYQLYYSTKKDSGFKKVDSYSANKLTGSKTFSASASGKTIYFKVRAYKKVNGQTIFSEWSAVKSVKLK